MNILEINTVDKQGGAAKIAYALNKELQNRGHHVSLFVKIKTAGDSNVHVIEPMRVSRWLFEKTGKDIGGYVSRKLHQLLATDIEFFNSDSILCTEEYKKADVIHCHNLHGNYFSLRTLEKIAREKPVIWTFHDMWPITPHCAHSYGCPMKDGFFECPSLNTYQSLLWHNERHLNNLKRTVYRDTDFSIVVPSKWLYEKVHGSVLKTKPTTLIYNGVDTEKFKKADQKQARTELSLPLDKKIVLFISVGKNASWKGWDYFTSLASSYENDNGILFLSIGNAEKYKSSASLKNIKYIDYINGEETLAKYYSAANVLLFASLAENFPLVILEAMSCGLPIVSFDVGGVKEALQHKENGYIARYADEEDFLIGAKYLLNLTEAQREKMSDDSSRRVQQLFSNEKMIDSYVAVYTDAIERFKKNIA